MIYKINYRKWYIMLTITSILISIFYFLTSKNIESSSIFEGIFTINISFHLMYLITGYCTRFQMFMVGKQNPIYKLSLKMMKIFGYIFIFAGVGVFTYILSLIIIPNEFQSEAYLAICIPFAFVLGGINLLQNIKKREIEIV